MSAPQGQIPEQGLEIGENLLWKYDETPFKRRCHERDYTHYFYLIPIYKILAYVILFTMKYVKGREFITKGKIAI